MVQWTQKGAVGIAFRRSIGISSPHFGLQHIPYVPLSRRRNAAVQAAIVSLHLGLFTARRDRSL
ncbi:MAG: hypothetical protein PHP62_00725 [Candidatus Moranbacteria bacterium]|nr:hypothetical protein [Candidatus Moranbacteria bacterium]